MKMHKLVLAIAVTSALASTAANATFLLPTSYDKQQDVKIDKNASDIVSLQAKDGQLRKDIDTTYALANSKYTEAAGKNLERQVTDLQNNKVDKSVFSVDQARQDKAHAELNSKVDGYAAQGAAAYTELKGADAATNDRISGLVEQGTTAYNGLKDSIGADKVAQSERDAGQDTHINAVQDAAQAANEKGDANAVRLDGVDKRNDAQDTHINAVQDVASAADSRSQNNAVRLDGAEGAIRETNAQVAVTDARSINNAVRLDGAEGAIRQTNTVVTSQGNRITNVEKVQSQHTGMLANHESRITSNTSEIKKTQTVVNQHSDQLVNHETRITNNETNINSLSNEYYQFQDTYNYNNQVINNNMRSYSAQAVQQSKAYTDEQVGQLRGETKRDRAEDQKEYRSGIASVAAMSQIPVVPGERFTVGAGIGQFKDRTALAVGVGMNVSSRVQAKASVGFANGDDAVAAAGFGFGF
ncbi:adhesin [Erwinia phage vB_EamM-Bue1]|uniref:STEC autoagglutinating adhesin n=1 Tax=Erwinia phage vB_EamM-Bue1 TaxID=2099338 RepID=A0A2P1JU31_9CAUD|nr:adhesin [Erwinia phage vB_EamM-Bue1]AVO22861.1 STEC autoagglutinating adhesin [Erwinia phage vB_EamM-Bue1]